MILRAAFQKCRAFAAFLAVGAMLQPAMAATANATSVDFRYSPS